VKEKNLLKKIHLRKGRKKGGVSGDRALSRGIEADQAYSNPEGRLQNCVQRIRLSRTLSDEIGRKGGRGRQRDADTSISKLNNKAGILNPQQSRLKKKETLL